MSGLYLYLFILNIFWISGCSSYDDDQQKDFDILIFTQHWPATNCFIWMNENPKHSCQLPSPVDMWSIHGIWPAKFGTRGPFNCNPSWQFDMKNISNIQTQLEQFWINIEIGTPVDQLWAHEWNKHGTCAAQLNELNSEEKYFGQGLLWLQQHTMTSILKDNQIVPGAAYKFDDIQNAVVKKLNITPVIQCYYHKHDKQQYLNEIRICFNKLLKMVDCDGVSYDSKIITNCDIKKLIQYPSKVPITLINFEEPQSLWKFPFVNFYKLIRFIKWATF